MKEIRSATLASAKSAAAKLNSIDGYPVAGVHVGGGRHVAIPGTWDGVGKPPPGWTAHVPLADGTGWALPLDEKTQAALTEAAPSDADAVLLLAKITEVAVKPLPVEER